MKRLLICLLLTGCNTVFVHPTKGEREFNEDLLDCETRAAPMQPNQVNAFVDRCLATKGWRPER